MNRLILHRSFNGKNKYIMMLLAILTILIYIFSLPFDAKRYELFLYNDYYKLTFNSLIIEIYRILIPIGFVIISFEHDQSYLRILTPLIGRDRLMFLKQFNYNFLLIITYLVLSSIYVIIVFIFDFYMLFDLNFIVNLLYLFIDCSIIVQLILLLCNQSKNLLAFLILIVYLVANFIYEAFPLNGLYYLLPFYSNYFINYTHTFYYKILYLILLYSLTFIFNRKIDYD